MLPPPPTPLPPHPSPAAPVAERGRVGAAFDRSVAASILPVARVVAVVQALLVVLKVLTLADPLRWPLVGTSVLCGGVAAAVAWLARRRPARVLDTPNLWLSVLGAAMLVAAAHHLLLSGEVWQLTNLHLVLLGAGGIALRWSAFALLSAGMWLTFGFVLGLHPEDPLAYHFGVATGLAQAVATTLVSHRRTVVARLAAAEAAALEGQRSAESLTARMALQQEELRRTVMERDALFATMTHELRSPIQAVLGVAQLISGPGAELPEAERRRAISTLRASGDMMLHVVNQVLDHSRIERGELEPNLQAVCLSELLDEVFLVVGERAAAQRDQLTWAPLGGAPPVVCVDRGWLRQVLLNVVGNAVKFTQDGLVRVTVAVSGQEGPVTVTLVVTDTGPGFPAEAAERIFAPYQQAGPGVAARFGGTGLGLAISRKLTQLMGGNVVAHSVLGEGARFEITLRAAATRSAERPLAGRRLSVVGRAGEGAAAVVAGDLRLRLAAMGAQLLAPSACAQHLLLRPGRDGRPPSLHCLGPLGARRLELPAEDAALQQIVGAEPSGARAEAPPLAGLHVLLVDDNAVCLTVSHMGLASLGHHVRVATDTAAALGIIDSCAAEGRPIEALVFDVHLASECGVALAQAARARPWGPAILVALTGDPTARRLLAGLATVLLKPALPAAVHAQLVRDAQARKATRADDPVQSVAFQRVAS